MSTTSSDIDDSDKSQIDLDFIKIEEPIKQYLSKNKIFLYILTPCYASVCHVNYVNSLIETKEVLKKYGIETTVVFGKNDSLISRIRNNLVAKAMNDHKMTHIMFIDNDIAWNPLDILKLLISDKNLVGGAYPIKAYKWNNLLQKTDEPNGSDKAYPSIIQKWVEEKNNSRFKNMITDIDMIRNNLVQYNINYLDPELKIENNLARVKHLATGFMMFKRNVVEKMSMAFPSTKYEDNTFFLKPHENKFAYALFDCGVEDGQYSSEDWMFCNRWRKMGGSIWIDVSIDLTHAGVEEYKGSFLSTII